MMVATNIVCFCRFLLCSWPFRPLSWTPDAASSLVLSSLGYGKRVWDGFGYPAGNDKRMWDGFGTGWGSFNINGFGVGYS